MARRISEALNRDKEEEISAVMDSVVSRRSVERRKDIQRKSAENQEGIKDDFFIPTAVRGGYDFFPFPRIIAARSSPQKGLADLAFQRYS